MSNSIDHIAATSKLWTALDVAISNTHVVNIDLALSIEAACQLSHTQRASNFNLQTTASNEKAKRGQVDGAWTKVPTKWSCSFLFKDQNSVRNLSRSLLLRSNWVKQVLFAPYCKKSRLVFLEGGLTAEHCNMFVGQGTRASPFDQGQNAIMAATTCSKHITLLSLS